MSEGTQNAFTVTVLPDSSAAQLKTGIASDSSNISATDGNNVSFVNITYTIQPHPFRSRFKELPSKKILDDVSGSMEPGLNAIMGPTGSGKTSLLDVLADRKAKKGLSGHVLINGRRQPDNFKCASAYVVQEDILMGTLSVRENLQFSAALRLPSSVSRRERAEKVENVISQLGLSRVANLKVGTELIRGISGGQKKRTSIGMELITSPSIVFLDEPTTGLDAATAVSVIKLLKNISRDNKVIIMSIHQPRYSIYKLFDSLTLMSHGRIVYHGPAANSLNYFSELGYQCEQHNNPADFILDIIIENEETDNTEDTTGTNQDDRDVVPAGRLANIYAESKEFLSVKRQLDQKLELALNEPVGKTPQFATNFLWQCGVVAVRTGRNLIRNRLASVVQAGMMIGLSIILGLIFLQVDDDFTGVQDRMGALFFIAINMGFINIPAVDLFIRERPIFVHQNVSGYYRVSTYFLAKVFCDLIPIRVIPAIFYCVIVYWMIGFEPDAGKFFFFLLTVALLSSTASALAFAISARAPVATIGIAGTALSFIIQVLFAGFLRNLDAVDDWISWIEYLSIFRYALNAIAVNELDGNRYPTGCTPDNTTSAFTCLDGTEYLERLGYLDFDVWFNILALFCFNVGFLVLAYINLRLLKKEK